MTYDEFVEKLDGVETYEAKGPIAAWLFITKEDENAIGLRFGCFTGCDEHLVDDDGKPHYLYGERTKERIKQSFIDVSKKYNIVGSVYGNIIENDK